MIPFLFPMIWTLYDATEFQALRIFNIGISEHYRTEMRSKLL